MLLPSIQTSDQGTELTVTLHPPRRAAVASAPSEGIARAGWRAGVAASPGTATGCAAGAERGTIQGVGSLLPALCAGVRAPCDVAANSSATEAGVGPAPSARTRMATATTIATPPTTAIVRPSAKGVG